MSLSPLDTRNSFSRAQPETNVDSKQPTLWRFGQYFSSYYPVVILYADMAYAGIHIVNICVHCKCGQWHFGDKEKKVESLADRFIKEDA